MLYSIIPPILVVLSLIGIILFLMKKAPQVALLDDSKRKEIGENGISGKRGFFGRIFFGSGNGEKKGLKHGFLFFLEKSTRKLRVLFLKLENLFTHWSESIKRKRKIHIESSESLKEENSPEASDNMIGESEMLERVKRYEPEEDIYKSNSGDIKVRTQIPKDEEKIIRPIISERVVTPRSKPEIKNRLERILIERIAANPKDIEAYERLGEYYFEIENYQHSKECFKQVIKLDPMNASVKDKMRKLERLLARR
jgi:hypothetical protein